MRKHHTFPTTARSQEWGKATQQLPKRPCQQTHRLSYDRAGAVDTVQLDKQPDLQFNMTEEGLPAHIPGDQALAFPKNMFCNPVDDPVIDPLDDEAGTEPNGSLVDPPVAPTEAQVVPQQPPVTRSLKIEPAAQNHATANDPDQIPGVRCNSFIQARVEEQVDTVTKARGVLTDIPVEPAPASYTMGTGFPISTSIRQKLGTRSSTKEELPVLCHRCDKAGENVSGRNSTDDMVVDFSTKPNQRSLYRNRIRGT